MGVQLSFSQFVSNGPYRIWHSEVVALLLLLVQLGSQVVSPLPFISALELAQGTGEKKLAVQLKTHVD